MPSPPKSPPGFHQFFHLFLLLIFSTFVSLSDQQLVVSRQRIRRRIPQFHAVEPKKFDWPGNSFGPNEEGKGPKFILKCPRTNKNISSVVWCLNGRPVFSVNFLENGQLEVGTDVDPKWAVEEKVWRSLASNRFELLLTAKKGRYRVEVENGGPEGRQWMVLKIGGGNGGGPLEGNSDLGEDGGEWKCQIFVPGPNGKEQRLEGESRKRIMVRPQRKTREFDSPKAATNQGSRHWELWDSLLEGRTFGFAKSDGDFAIFQRMTSQSARTDDAIEYTRMTEGREDENDGLILNALDGGNSWRWRRARSNSSLPPQFPILLNLVLPIIFLIFIFWHHQI